jgi:nicotinamide mononucleotide adenylyltransferase
MKSFLELTEEKTKKLAILFGRMNPPTKGHEENVEGLKSLAAKQGADHLVIASHSHDAKKNPLSPDVKLKHLKRAFPNTNITTSSKQMPTILHAASEAHKKGYTHLTVVAGADRVPEYEKLLKHYNGKFKDEAGQPLRHGGYNFKKIQVLSTGERKKGISGTDMRNHAQNNDFNSFHQNLSSAMRANVQHARELFRDVRKGMGLNENRDRGMFKAIFVTGGPGSGKDVVIREAIAEQKIVEITSVQAFNYLMDKKTLSEKSSDFRRESIRNRGPLVINGPADDQERMLTIKEELEELGYSTYMVFVDTTNEASQARNEKLTKMIAESVRRDKWESAQASKNSYSQSFTNFTTLNNNESLETLEEEITDIYQKLNRFIDTKISNEQAYSWLESHNKLNTNIINQSFVEEQNYDKMDFRFIQKLKESRNPKLTRGTGGRAATPSDIPADNRANDPAGDNIKWDGTKKSRGSFVFRTYTENKEASLQIFPEPKENNFNKDKEKNKLKNRFVNSPTVSQRERNVATVGPEYDTRQQGTVYPMSGLGDVTYREETNNTYKNVIKEFKGFQNDMESGLAGALGGADNKEPIENPKDKLGYTFSELKRKKAGKK